MRNIFIQRITIAQSCGLFLCVTLCCNSEIVIENSMIDGKPKQEEIGEEEKLEVGQEEGLEKSIE